MMNINEEEIIPLLKVAQAGYTQIIIEGDPEKIEGAEKIEQALINAMDIVYDYQSMAEEVNRLHEHYETAGRPISRGMDFYQCPACCKRTSRNHTHCHWCGKKLRWDK